MTAVLRPLARVAALTVGFVLLLGASLGSSACQSSFDLEGRDVRVNVWLTDPSMAAQGGQVQALIYVGAVKVVDGPVVFPQGASTVSLPPVYVRSGDTRVSAVLRQGALAIQDEVDIEGESWIQFVVRGRELDLEFDDQQPDVFGAE